MLTVACPLMSHTQKLAGCSSVDSSHSSNFAFLHAVPFCNALKYYHNSIFDCPKVTQNFARVVRFHSPVTSWFLAVHVTLFHGSSACHKRFALSPSVELCQNLGLGTAHTMHRISSGALPKAPKPVVVNSRGYLHRMVQSALQKISLRNNA